MPSRGGTQLLFGAVVAVAIYVAVHAGGGRALAAFYTRTLPIDPTPEAVAGLLARGPAPLPADAARRPHRMTQGGER